MNFSQLNESFDKKYGLKESKLNEEKNYPAFADDEDGNRLIICGYRPGEALVTLENAYTEKKFRMLAGDLFDNYWIYDINNHLISSPADAVDESLKEGLSTTPDDYEVDGFELDVEDTFEDAGHTGWNITYSKNGTPLVTVELWDSPSPVSVVENLYGPNLFQPLYDSFEAFALDLKYKASRYVNESVELSEGNREKYVDMKDKQWRKHLSQADTYGELADTASNPKSSARLYKMYNAEDKKASDALTKRDRYDTGKYVPRRGGVENKKGNKVRADEYKNQFYSHDMDRLATRYPGEILDIAKERAVSRNESLKEAKCNNCYRGCPDVEMIWNGEWSDPELEYNGYVFNYWDIEDALWNDFLDATGHKDSESGNPKVEKEFNQFVKDNCTSYLEDVIYGGYFQDGSMDWAGRDLKNESCKRKKKAVKESFRRAMSLSEFLEGCYAEDIYVYSEAEDDWCDLYSGNPNRVPKDLLKRNVIEAEVANKSNGQGGYDKAELQIEVEYVNGDEGLEEACKGKKCKKGLKEARWKYQLKNGTALRSAIDAEDIDGILATLQMCYQELADAGIIDQDDCDSYVEDLEIYDADDEDIEDSVDYELSNFYDLCDNTGVWVPLSESMNEAENKPTANVQNHAGSFAGIVQEHKNEIDDFINKRGKASEFIDAIKGWVADAKLTGKNKEYAQKAILKLAKMRYTDDIGIYLYNIFIKADNKKNGAITSKAYDEALQRQHRRKLKESYKKNRK